MCDIKAKLLSALSNGEFRKFLEGISPYEIQMHQWVSANVPTDVSKALSLGIYKLYESDKEARIDIMLEEELISMLDSDIFDVYMALSIIFNQLLLQSYGTAPFKLSDDVLKKLKTTLTNRENELKQYKEWQGLGNENGVWTEVIRMNNIISNKFNITIL